MCLLELMDVLITTHTYGHTLSNSAGKTCHSYHSQLLQIGIHICLYLHVHTCALGCWAAVYVFSADNRLRKKTKVGRKEIK
jgi:hypothetical protein